MDVWQAFQDPHLLHATAVHFVVALGILGFPLLIAAAVTKMRPALRFAALVVYLLLAVAALAAMVTGTSINLENAPVRAARPVELHTAFARYIWVPAVAIVLLLMLTQVRREWFRSAFALLATLAAAFAAGLVFVATFYGQLLVYEHGMGIRARVTAPAVVAPLTMPRSIPSVPSKSADPATAKEKEMDMLEGIEVVGPAPVAKAPSGPDAAATGPNAGMAPTGGDAEKIAALRDHARQGGRPRPEVTETFGQKAASMWDRGVKWSKKYLWPF